MSNSRPSTNNLIFTLLCCLTMVAGASVLALWWPALVRASNRRANQFLTPRSVSASTYELQTRLANLLDRRNVAAATAVASMQLAAGDVTSAERTLAGAPGQASPAYQVAQLRVNLELGHVAAIRQWGSRLTSEPVNDSALLLVGLSDGVINQPSAISPLQARVSSVEAVSGLQRAAAGKTALAAELYAQGLPMSAERILRPLPISLTRNLLLAAIMRSTPTPAHLAEASSLYEAALSIEPASTTIRSLLISTLQASGNTTAAAHQQQLLTTLKNGTP